VGQSNQERYDKLLSFPSVLDLERQTKGKTGGSYEKDLLVTSDLLSFKRNKNVGEKSGSLGGEGLGGTTYLGGGLGRHRK